MPQPRSRFRWSRPHPEHRRHSHLRRSIQALMLVAGAANLAATESSGLAHDRTASVLQARIDAAAPGQEILLKSGVYELDAPLRIQRPVTLRAAPGAEVVLSGGRRLALDWAPYAGGILRAALPDEIDFEAVAFDQLFLDGHRLHPARYPNHDPDRRFFGGTAEDALSPGRIAAWYDPAGGYIHSLHRSEWGGNHWRITGKTDDGALALEGGWMNNRPSGINPTRRFVEGIFEELDAPGEWFLDRRKRFLYIYPPEGVDLMSAAVTVSGLERLIECVGESPDRPVLGLRLAGVTLAYTARTFMKTSEPLLRSDWMIHRGGAIFLKNVRNATIEDCVLRDLGGNGIFVSGYADGVVVRGCHLTGLGASGICFVGNPDAVRSPSFRYGEAVAFDRLDWEPGPQTEDYPRDCLVDDCLVHDLGTVEKQVAGVQISMAARITVRHASIYDVPRAGINISEGTWGGHLVDGCDVFDTVQMTGDHGSFNSWGRDRFWHPDRKVMNRLTREYPELILLDALETTVLRNSRWRCDHGWDIDLDDGSSNYELYNNLCLGGGIKLREGFHRKVHNNIMINNSFHPHVWFEDSHDQFERNIVMTWYRPIRLAGWGDSVDFNLLPDEAAMNRSREIGLDAHSAFGDPEFIAPAVGDYRVGDASPALALGFRNFPMDRFGVRKPSLRRIARTPVIPGLGVDATSSDARIRTFLGAAAKRLQGLGERSATGTGAERGVLLREVPEGSIAHAAGFQPNDVILRVGGFQTDHPSQLQPAYLQTGVVNTCDVVVFRNQQEQILPVPGVRAIRLEAEEAHAAGEGKAPVYDSAKDYTGRWTDASASLAWDIECRGPVTFDVYVELAGTTDAEGAAWSFTIAGQVLEGVTPDTGGWEIFRRIPLGQIRFECYGDVHARLTPLQKPGGAVMNLRAVELVLSR